MAIKTTHVVSVEQQVEDCIRGFLEEDAALGAAVGVNKSPLRPVVDSLVIVEVLVQVEGIVNQKLPLSLIRRGGYYSVDDAVAHLVPRIMSSLT